MQRARGNIDMARIFRLAFFAGAQSARINGHQRVLAYPPVSAS